MESLNTNFGDMLDSELQPIMVGVGECVPLSPTADDLEKVQVDGKKM